VSRRGSGDDEWGAFAVQLTILVQEELETTKSEHRIRLRKEEEILKNVKSDLNEEREGRRADNDAADLKLNEVKNEVARRVPELARNALEKAENEWKKRLDDEVANAVKMMDSHVAEAHDTVADLQNTVNDYREKEVEVQSKMMKLSAENKNLEREIEDVRQESVVLKMNHDGGNGA